jgi:hypothetical protein
MTKKKKGSPKKLSLKKKSVLRLSIKDMEKVVGGYGQQCIAESAVYTDRCASNYCAPPPAPPPPAGGSSPDLRFPGSTRPPCC